MKQHITVKQTKELSEKATQRIIEYALQHSPQNWQCRCPCKCPLMDIDQMVKFMRDNRTMMGIDWFLDEGKRCDKLWEMVKEVLEKK